MPTAAPSFASPPLVETALGIQFRELNGFGVTHFGLFYSTVADRYPTIEDTPRLERIVEHFPRRPMVAGMKFRAVTRPERVFFKDAEDASELVQLQPDRFGFNWRKPADSRQPYPRYSENSKKCLEEFRRFTDFCGKWGLGDVSPDLCEVVYVNHLYPETDESPSGLFTKVFSGLTWNTLGLLGLPDAAQFNRVFVIGADRGRLYAEASIAHDKDRGDFVAFKITARTLHREADDLEDTLSLAHEWAVRGFVELTNEDVRVHRWGQTS
jgi:uncharacterized protein (TIGR04255 family)